MTLFNINWYIVIFTFKKTKKNDFVPLYVLFICTE